MPDHDPEPPGTGPGPDPGDGDERGDGRGDQRDGRGDERDSGRRAVVLEVVVRSPEDVDAASAWFAGHGCDVGPFGPISFTITATAGALRDDLHVDEPTRERLAAPPRRGDGEITVPTDALPRPLRAAVVAIVRPSVPDFGPGMP